MSETTSKVRSLTRLNVRRIPPEYLGRTVVESRKNQSAEATCASYLPTQHALLGFELLFPSLPVEDTVPQTEEWNWCELPPVGNEGRAWIVVMTGETTPTSSGDAQGWPVRYEEVPGSATEALPRVGFPEFLTEALPAGPDQELEVHVRPEPSRLKKITARIVRRTRGKPNPILE
jgi:hypothetical protein